MFPTETVYVTSKGKQTTFSEVGVFEIPAGHTMSQKKLSMLSNLRKLITILDYITVWIIKEHQIIMLLVFTIKNKKPILNPTKDDIKDIRYVATSERYSLGMQDGLSSIKLGIPGTGVGKALVTPVQELTGLKDDPDVDLIMHPDLFPKVLSTALLQVLSPVGEKQSIIEAKVAIAESTLSWNKDTELKPIDMVTITNGRTNADGALSVGKFTFGFKGDDFYYDSTNVAKIAQLKSTAYARDYNTTNAARVYNFLRLSSLLKYIDDSDWESSSFKTKSEFLKELY